MNLAKHDHPSEAEIDQGPTTPLRLHNGLGEALRPGNARGGDRVDLTWPSGKVESWDDLPAGGTLRLVEGTGVASP